MGLLLFFTSKSLQQREGPGPKVEVTAARKISNISCYVSMKDLRAEPYFAKCIFLFLSWPKYFNNYSTNVA